MRLPVPFQQGHRDAAVGEQQGHGATGRAGTDDHHPVGRHGAHLVIGTRIHGVGLSARRITGICEGESLGLRREIAEQ